MAEDQIHQPNDKLLKATFSSPENAPAFFKGHLPRELAEALDWTSLTLEPCSFIDPQLSSSESDLLFHISLHQSDAFIYLLFEHQSSEDPRMALRLLSYVLRIWERFAQNNPPPTKLPAILPIVLAQGKRPWKMSTHLDALIELPPAVAHILRPWQPTLTYHLLELVRIPYDALAGTPEGILTLRALKAAPMNELLDDVLWDESLLFAISDSALERILRYLLKAEVSVTQLKERLGKIQTKPLQSKTMTLADQLRQEGKIEGIIKGKQEGQLRAFRTAVFRALEISHGACPGGLREALDSIADPTRLEMLFKNAMRSESLEAFVQNL
jgi:hypothetical protein